MNIFKSDLSSLIKYGFLIVIVFILYMFGKGNRKVETNVQVDSSLPSVGEKRLGFMTNFNTSWGEVSILVGDESISIQPFENVNTKIQNVVVKKSDYPELFKQGIAKESVINVGVVSLNTGKELIQLSNIQPDHGGYSPTYRLFINPDSSEVTFLTGKQTQVEVYKSEIIPDEKKEGDCWTDSIAAPTKVGAWRCKVAELIYDPCFETNSNRVVCNANVNIPNYGFELVLTKPLPKSQVAKSDSDESIWRVLLSNQLVCYKVTGAAPMIEGAVYSYQCGDDETKWIRGNSLEAFDRTKGEWVVQLASFVDGKEEIHKTEVVGVDTVWK